MEWLIFGLFLVFVVGLLALAAYQEKKRREALEQVARSLGMSFSAELPEGIRSRLLQAGFELFERGYNRRFYNLLSKQPIDGAEIAVFDYKYTSSSGKSRSTYRQSVFWAYCEDLRLPHFRLHPEIALFHGIAKAFGMQDINFESHPKFSRSYLLRGEDEAKVRLRFHPSFLNFLEQHTPCCAEGSGPQLIVWREYQLVSPEKMADWLRFGEEWVQRLRLHRI